MNIDLIDLFPGLIESGFQHTSEPSTRYNCFAWAAEDDSRWWDPTSIVLYWPEGIPRTVSMEAYTALFQKLGYMECDDGKLEEGFDKIVLYAKKGQPTHAARQLPDGNWTSKLGSLDDIAHSLGGLSGDQYGEPRIFMKRAKG